MSRLRGPIFVAVPVVAFAILLAQHWTPGDPVIDSWAIGPELECTPADRCPDLLKVASTGLDRRDPGHAAVLSVALHSEGLYVDGLGYRHGVSHSGGCCYVARFELADGSLRAVGVGWPGIDPQPRAFDYEGP